MRRRSVLQLWAWVAACMLGCLGGNLFAQTPRFLVVQSKGLYAIEHVSTGGKFIWAPTSERVRVPGRKEQQVVGYTDRAARGEQVVTTIAGAGVAHVTVTYTPQGSHRTRTIFSGALALPAVVPSTVSANAQLDNITVTVNKDGKVTSRRLPIGSRSGR